MVRIEIDMGEKSFFVRVKSWIKRKKVSLLKNKVDLNKKLRN